MYINWTCLNVNKERSSCLSDFRSCLSDFRSCLSDFRSCRSLLIVMRLCSSALQKGNLNYVSILKTLF